MCGVAEFSIAMALASTGASVYAKRQQQQATNASAKHQARLAEAQQEALNADSKISQKNSEIAQKAVTSTREESARARLTYLKRSTAQQNKLQGAFAAQGITVGADSAGDEINTIQELTAVDERTLYDNYERQAFGFQTQADDLIHRRDQQLKGAQQFGMNAAYQNSISNNNNLMSQAASLTKGGSGALGSYFNFKNAGAFG